MALTTPRPPAAPERGAQAPRRRRRNRDVAPAPPPRSTTRAAIPGRHLRKDRWWMQPLVTFLVLAAFIVYGTWAAFRNGDYFADPYLSPFYSPCLTDSCVDGYTPEFLGDFWTLSPALLILPFPLGFRLTCYYYRKAYYRSFWLSPPACAVADAHRKYTGERRFPLIFQNVHRYFFYLALPFAVLLSYDAARAFDFPDGFGVGVGTGFLVVNAVLIWTYTLSCHSCRHLCGGGLRKLSAHPLRARMWRFVSVLNGRHMSFAWASLIWIAFTDLYIYLVAAGHLTDYAWTV
jgi:hypothetical protein